MTRRIDPDRAPLQVSAAGLTPARPRGHRTRDHLHRPGTRTAASPSTTGAHPPMPKSYADLLREARAQIREVSPQEVDALPAGAATIVDVREDSEWEQGHLPGAHHVSKSYIEQQIEGVAPDRDAPVILYCAGGVRSLFAAQTLAEMGYTDVASMSSGFQGWKGAGLELRDAGRPDRRPEAALQPPPADPRGRGRGPGHGCSARRRCSSARAASARRRSLYLAAAGVGTIGIVDFDIVDVSNLQRQIVHTTDRVGERKVEIRQEVDQRAQPRGQGRRSTRRCSSPPTSSGSSPATTSSSTGPTRSRRATSSTTRRSRRTSRSSTPASSGSRAS